MREAGYEVKYRGKSLEFRAPGQARFTRSFRLGEEYTEQRLWERAAGQQYKMQKTENRAASRAKQQDTNRQVNLLVDIQAKLQEGKDKSYERWAKVFNLKEAAKTVNFLTEKGVTDYGELEARAESACQRFDSLSARIKQLEDRMAQKAQLKMYIINYSKTRDVYTAYKKTRDKEGFWKLHSNEIEKHEAAKAAFDALKGEKIPKVAELSKEYAELLAEKKACYEEYKETREEMIEFQTAKRNVDRILGTEAAAQKKQQDKKWETEV